MSVAGALSKWIHALSRLLWSKTEDEDEVFLQIKLDGLEMPGGQEDYGFDHLNFTRSDRLAQRKMHDSFSSVNNIALS